MTVEIQVNESGRYPIGEAAKILGIHRNTLRKYTDEGMIKCGFRRESGKRFYLGSELLRFWRAAL